jgi:hypothetical protein
MTKNQVSILRSSLVEYVTFVASTGELSEEAVIRNFRITASKYESDVDRVLKQIGMQDNEI